MSDVLEPIEGVSIETYGKLQAKRTSGIPQEEFAKLVAAEGMDMEKFGRVEKGWNDRMSSDATATVATAYGAAFAGSGAGQFGAAGAEAAAGMQWNAQGANMMPGATTATTAADPIPFDRYCEIYGATQAWAETGQDVNAMMTEEFELTAMDWANIQTHFMNKGMADLTLLQKQEEIAAKYKQQYIDAAGGSADDDIDF